MYTGSEKFILHGKELDNTVSDFWRWAYSDFINNIGRSVLAEYIVASALDITSIDTEMMRKMFRPYDLLTKEGIRVEVKCASYIQTWGAAKHPDRVSFRIAPARMPDDTGDYNSKSPLQRNCDIYVFSLFKGMTADCSPLNLDLWEFYILPTSVLDDNMPTQKTITYQSLMRLQPILTDYYGIEDGIKQLMSV